MKWDHLSVTTFRENLTRTTNIMRTTARHDGFGQTDVTWQHLMWPNYFHVQSRSADVPKQVTDEKSSFLPLCACG